MTDFRKRALARKYVNSGVDYLQEYVNEQGALHQHEIDKGIERLENYANTARMPLVDVSRRYSFQVWIRSDREACFRAQRALLNG